MDQTRVNEMEVCFETENQSWNKQVPCVRINYLFKIFVNITCSLNFEVNKIIISHKRNVFLAK
jgi:hypothetical protein